MDGVARTLRPLSLGELLDQTLALYRQNFVLFAGLVAVLAVPQAIVVTALNLSRPSNIVTGSGPEAVIHGDRLGTSVAISVIGLVVGEVFAALITGALAQAISARYLGRSITVVEAYSSIGWPTSLRLVAASIIRGILLLLGLLTLGIMSVVFFVRYLFISQAIVLERTGLFGAFGRSWRLTYGSFWRILGYSLVVYIIAAVFEGIVGGIPNALLALGGRPAFSGLFSAIATVLIEPFQLGALTLLYYDLRVRTEGFDLEYLAQNLTL
jgi:hypothetical protein